jgi:hypothetical protein
VRSRSTAQVANGVTVAVMTPADLKKATTPLKIVFVSAEGAYFALALAPLTRLRRFF